MCFQVKAKIDIAAAGGGMTKIRLPYPREVTDRKAIKEVLVRFRSEKSLFALAF
jgi:hypothetical protein